MSSCRPFLIGISGPKEHGKTTLAGILEQKLPSVSKDVSGYDDARPLATVWDFSEPMIEMAKILTQDKDFSKHKVYEIVRGKPLTGTQVLQLISTEAIRNTFGMDTWTEYLMKLITTGDLCDFEWVIVPGVRLPIQEQQMMDFSIWVEAPGTTSTQCVNHITESHLEQLKKNADLSIVRHGDQYNPPINEIVAKIVHARQASQGLC